MRSSEVLMETVMFYLLIFIAVCQAACLALLILTAGKNRGEKTEEPEPVKTDEYEDYLEKLWQEGLNGIMSYGISNAAGKKRSDE